MLSSSVVSESLPRHGWTFLSMGFSRQEYWSGLPFSSPGDLPDPGIEPASLMSPALASGFSSTSTTWKAFSKEGINKFTSFRDYDIDIVGGRTIFEPIIVAKNYPSFSTKSLTLQISFSPKQTWTCLLLKSSLY